MANADDFIRYSIYSNKDPSTGKYNIPSNDSDFRKFERAIKSALPSGAFYYTNKEMSNSGRARWDVYVHPASSNAVGQSLGTIEQSLLFKGSKGQQGAEKYHVTRPQKVDDLLLKTLQDLEKQQTENNKHERDRRDRGGGGSSDSEGTKQSKWQHLKIVALITTLTDITRRILSTVIDRATITSQNMLTAHNLGMSYDAVRGYRQAEIVHGLKTGTVTGAVADIQSKFGNITSLDEKALEALAVVMGGKIEEMATMGLGASNPEKVLASIVDAFNERANSGYNSVGQYVGEQQARRELYSYLLKVSPQIADIFATMQEEQHNINSLYQNQADTFENWKNAFPTARGGNGWAQYGELKIVSEQWQQIKSIVDQLKEGIAVTLADSVMRLLQRIANSRAFMTESEKVEANIRNKKANQAELEAINRTLSGVTDPNSLSIGERAYYDVLVEQKSALEKELRKEVVDDITTLPAVLEARAEKKVRIPTTSVDPYTGAFYTEVIPTEEELEQYAKIYGDTPENRERYAKYVQAQVDEANKKAVNEAKKVNKKSQRELKSEFNAKKKGAERAFKSSNTILPAGMTALKGLYNMTPSEFNNLMTLYSLGEVYNFAYDLENAEAGDTYGKRMYYYLDKAVDAGYATKSKGGKYSISNAEYVSGRYVEVIPYQETRAEADFNSPEFYQWLYEHDKLGVTSTIEGLRADAIVSEMQKGSSVQSIDWLNDSVEAMKTLAELNKKYPSASYIFRGENIAGNGGENAYKIIVDIKENGKNVGSRTLLTKEGVSGFQDIFGYSQSGSNIIVTGKPADFYME